LHEEILSDFKHVIVECRGAIAVVTVNRPKVLNALSGATVVELSHAFAGLKADSAVRAVVLTGAGERAFIAGADIAELAEMAPAAAQLMARRGQALADAIEQLGKPVVAAINGYALGGGCEIAMACTLRVAAETAKLGQPEIKLGLIPGYGGTQRLPRLVGRGRALELMLTGEPITAGEAWRIGLVNTVVPAAEVRGAAGALAATLAAQAPLAVRGILDAVHGGLEVGQHDGCELEAALFGLVTATDDRREGTRAFLEKRPPVFKGS
jgi:enoyl-CoA hydratase/carnithine racemase